MGLGSPGRGGAGEALDSDVAASSMRACACVPRIGVGPPVRVRLVVRAGCGDIRVGGCMGSRCHFARYLLGRWRSTRRDCRMAAIGPLNWMVAVDRMVGSNTAGVQPVPFVVACYGQVECCG